MKAIYKDLIRIVIVLAGLFIISISAYAVDISRAKNNQKPIFVINKTLLDDGGTVVYSGLGYQIVVWHKMTGRPRTFYYGVESHYLAGFYHSGDQPDVVLTEIKDD